MHVFQGTGFAGDRDTSKVTVHEFPILARRTMSVVELIFVDLCSLIFRSHRKKSLIDSLFSVVGPANRVFFSCTFLSSCRYSKDV